MLENLMTTLSRIEEIKSRFEDSRPKGVVSIAPHYAPDADQTTTDRVRAAINSQPSNTSGSDEIKPYFPETLKGVVKAKASSLLAESGQRQAAFNNIIEYAADKYGVEPSLVKAVIKAESGFNPNARSAAGAQGLMQLMPATARSLGVTDSFDPIQNIEGGVKYLKKQLDTFGDVRLALAAYNAGPNAVVRHGGIPPYRETQNYVQKVLSYMNDFE
ncbi:MAG: lytic transglycosylase domain-containing protein [Armatimonadota bacterium]